MIWDSTESELRCRLAAQAFKLKNRKPFLTFAALSQWLGCYQYIEPDQRKIYPQIIYTDTDLFFYWMFTDLLKCCFTYNEQEMIWKLTKES